MRVERQPTGRAARAVGFLALGALVLGANAGAQTIPAHPSDLTYELLDFTPPTAVEHRHELSNGIVVFVVEDHELPLVAVGVTVRTGTHLDPPDKIALASLTGSQMRAGGTTTMSAAEFDEEAAFLAAQIGSSIGDTSGGASMNCLTRDLDACLDLSSTCSGTRASTKSGWPWPSVRRFSRWSAETTRREASKAGSGSG